MDTEYAAVSTVNLGRHSDVVEGVAEREGANGDVCMRATKKQLLVKQNSPDPSLYVRTECDGCGVLDFMRFEPSEDMLLSTEE